MWRPAWATTSRAGPSPASASSVTVRPAIGPSASAFPRAESGSRSAASLPAFAIAVPEASASTQPWFGQLPWQGGPSSSISMCPS